MADQKTKAGVTGDDIQKAKDYADAMDKLKASISGVNSTLPSFRKLKGRRKGQPAKVELVKLR